MKNGDKPVTPLMDRFGHPTMVNNVEYLDNKMTGLTKREYFAAMAMQGGIMAAVKQGQDADKIVIYALKCADALLKELEKDND